MKKNTARKLSAHDSALSTNPLHPVQLVVKQEDNPEIFHETVYMGKRFRGDLLVYFIGIGIWMLGTVWLVIRLIDKFF